MAERFSCPLTVDNCFFYAYNEIMNNTNEKVVVELLTPEQLEAHRLTYWEHYHRLFKETKFFLYYVHSRGYVEKYAKKDLDEEGPLFWFFSKVNAQLYKRNKKNKHEEYLSVIIDHRRYPVKQLVASTFSRIWKPGSRIMHKDGKITNCNFENLEIIPPGSHKRVTHRGKEIEVLIQHRWRRYPTLKEAADKLNISLSSFRRYISRKDVNDKPNNKNKIRFRFVQHSYTKTNE